MREFYTGELSKQNLLCGQNTSKLPFCGYCVFWKAKKGKILYSY